MTSPVAPIDFSSPEFSVPSVPVASRSVLERSDDPFKAVAALFSCNHIGTQLTVRPFSNGSRRAYQCLRCGTMISNAVTPEDRKKPLGELPAWDETRNTRFNEARSAANKLAGEIADEKRKQQRYAKDRQWGDWYNQYLQSGQWRKRRQKVFERDGYRCQACLEKEATEVHHLNYEHCGNEPLFDLISVCHSCHEAITEMDRKRSDETS